MELFFGYLAGLLTLINPCILPVLPIAVAAASSASRLGPLVLAAGMAVAFTTLGVATASVGPAIGVTPDLISQVAASLMVMFGLVMLVPRASAVFAAATVGVAGAATARLGAVEDGGVRGQFLGGMLLGAVWSPCIGPTLGGAISLASQGASLAWAGAVMLAFSLGVATIFLLLSYGARGALGARSAGLRAVAAWSRPIMGAVFVAVGLALLLRLHHVAEAALLDAMPVWLQDFSVRF